MSAGLRALALLPVAALVAVGVNASNGDSDDTTEIVAMFSDASPLLAGNEVRTHGVKVGKIKSIDLDDGQARIVLELDPTALPIHQDARLTVRPVSLLGERFVDLSQGSPDAPLLQDGGVLKATQTGSSVGLDQVVDTLNAPTSASLGMMINALGVGLDGNGQQVQDAIKALAPSLRNTTALTTVLRDQNKTLGQLVDSMEPVARGLAADDGRALDTLVDASRDTLAATAADDIALRAMIDQLPATLQQTRATLGKLDGAAQELTPTLADLRPTTSDLTQLSNELDAFGDAAAPALRSATPMLARAEKLLEAARPVAASLRRGSPALRTTAQSLDPVTRDLGGNFTAVMEFFKGWALTTNGSDGLSHYFRAGLVLSPRDSSGLPATSGSKSGSGTTGGLNLPGVGGLVDGLTAGLLPGKTDSTGGVTGLTGSQESSALGFLLGGE